MIENPYPNLDGEFVEKVANYLASVDFNDAYISHFLENVNEVPLPVEYVLLKFPDFEDFLPNLQTRKSKF